MRFTTVTFDAADPAALADWWAVALEYERVGISGCRAKDGTAPLLEFVPVPEPKTSKNRVHIGCSTADLDAEMERLIAMGATFAWEEEFPPEWPYRNAVLRDPEGNEFCLGTEGVPSP
jgi:predicted enzyme related to lactoylglutathione lyase